MSKNLNTTRGQMRVVTDSTAMEADSISYPKYCTYV